MQESQKTIECDLNITSYLLLKEAKKDGSEWDVVVIQEGWSKNKKYYPIETLKAAIPLFEGVKVHAYQFGEGFADHLPDIVAEKMPEGFSRNLAGWIDNVRLKEVSEKKALVARLHLTDPFFRKTFKNAWAEDKSDLLGFSIDAGGSVMDAVREGMSGQLVKEINKVNSLDIVSAAAAGGRLLRLVASMKNNYKGGHKMWKKLIEAIRNDPTLIGLKESEGLKDKKDEEILALLTEAVSPAKEEKENAAEEKKAEDESKEPEKKEPEKKDEPGTEPTKEATENVQKAISLLNAGKVEDAVKMLTAQKESAQSPIDITAITELLDKFKTDAEAKTKESVESFEKKLKCKDLLKESLESSTLPDIVQDKIKESYKGQVFEKDALDKEIKQETDILARLSESDKPFGITVGREKADKLQAGFDLMVGLKPDKENYPEDEAYYKDVPAMVSLRESYIRMTGDRAISGQFDHRITEAVSSDFPVALGTSMNKRMVREYSRLRAKELWEKVVTTRPINDFKRQDIARWGGLADIPIVLEDAAYTTFTSPSEENPNYTPNKRGKIFSLTREMIKNDDLRTVQLWPVKLARAANRTLTKFVFDFIINYGSGAINGGTIYDAKALYHADHDNITTDALDYTPLDNAITAMANQLEADSDEPLGLMMKWLVVPYEKRSASKILVDSEKRPAATGQPGSIESVNPNYKAVEVIPTPKGYLRADSNNWYGLCDKADCETIEIGFIDGQEEPTIILQDDPKVDLVYTNDRIRYKVRHEYGGATVDYRGFYGGIEAGIS